MRVPKTLRGKRVTLDDSGRTIVVVCGICGLAHGPYMTRVQATIRALEHWSERHHEHDTTGCKMPGCERPHKAHGLCVTHYRRLVRRGDPSVTKGRRLAS